MWGAKYEKVVLYYFIIRMSSGYFLFNYGFLSLLVYHFCLPMFAVSFKYFYTGQVNYISTGAILILLLLSPTLYSIIAYIKHRTTTNIKSLLNSAENITEKEIVEPPISQILPLKPIYH